MNIAILLHVYYIIGSACMMMIEMLLSHKAFRIIPV